ncbi:hypothetical protein [Natronorubrum sp. FCH18a]|uniref:hypothetical protein n=1 Tax=Natronorubrum sp. FCH18a TaxID=3447018 RepID=UPI003F518DA7
MYNDGTPDGVFSHSEYGSTALCSISRILVVQGMGMDEATQEEVSEAIQQCEQEEEDEDTDEILIADE